MLTRAMYILCRGHDQAGEGTSKNHPFFLATSCSLALGVRCQAQIAPKEMIRLTCTAAAPSLSSVYLSSLSGSSSLIKVGLRDHQQVISNRVSHEKEEEEEVSFASFEDRDMLGRLCRHLPWALLMSELS